VLEVNNGKFLVGMVDPTDLPAFDEIVRILRCEIDVAIVTESKLLESIDRLLPAHR